MFKELEEEESEEPLLHIGGRSGACPANKRATESELRQSQRPLGCAAQGGSVSKQRLVVEFNDLIESRCPGRVHSASGRHAQGAQHPICPFRQSIASFRSNGGATKRAFPPVNPPNLPTSGLSGHAGWRKTSIAVSLRLYDAHNHLHDGRFGGGQPALLAACAREGVVRMVVNGSSETDWLQVLAAATPGEWADCSNGREARRGDGGSPRILPSFGYHPWYLYERTPDWLGNLSRFLDRTPSVVGEIGLDRWKPGLAYEGQEAAFIAQLQLAAERNLPVSIHCLQAWGRMFEILKAGPRPARGFLLHSYGGPIEMVKPFADLGAYFSLPGFYAHERKKRQRESFRHVPAARLLIETDAPDQCLPESRDRYPLRDPLTGKALNHPANLRAVYDFAAEFFDEAIESFATRLEQNFWRLFGGL